MLGKIGESLFFELYFMKKYGIRWRKKAWELTPDMKHHNNGIMTLWGKRVPAIESNQFHYYHDHSKIPDQIHSVGIILVIIGLSLQFSIFNSEHQ